MASTTTLYKSITLQPGEMFTLPPGGELLGATSSDELESTCDLPELEELDCYVASLATLSISQSGSDTVFWGHDESDTGAAQILGFTLSDVPTLFTTPYRNEDPSIYLDMRFSVNTIFNMLAEMKSLGVGFTQFNTNAEPGDLDNGTITYVLIKTIPSVANNLKLIYSSFAPGVGTVTYEVPFIQRDLVTPGDNNTVPVCP